MIKLFIKLAKRLLAKKKFANSRFLKSGKWKHLLKSKKSVKEKQALIKAATSKKAKAKYYGVKYLNDKETAWTTSNINPQYKNLPKVEKLTAVEKAQYKRAVEPLKETLQKAIMRRERGFKLGKKQEEALYYFERLELSERLDKKSNQRYWYFTFDSDWLINGVYDTYTKLCFLKMKSKQNRTYTFFGVPQTKMRALIVADSSGKFMWDYFGAHYSINKQHWIRNGA